MGRFFGPEDTPAGPHGWRRDFETVPLNHPVLVWTEEHGELVASRLARHPWKGEFFTHPLDGSHSLGPLTVTHWQPCTPGPQGEGTYGRGFRSRTSGEGS